MAVSINVDFTPAGPEAAAALALLWARAEARRKGEPLPPNVDAQAVEAVRNRLEDEGAVALLGAGRGGPPVAGCFATQAVKGGDPVVGRAHVSGIAVDPDRWGEGLAHGLLRSLEVVLIERDYDLAQLYVLETNDRARAVYEHIGWRLLRTREPHPAGPHAVYERQLRPRK